MRKKYHFLKKKKKEKYFLFELYFCFYKFSQRIHLKKCVSNTTNDDFTY